jgi:hypothetical protein
VYVCAYRINVYKHICTERLPIFLCVHRPAQALKTPPIFDCKQTTPFPHPSTRREKKKTSCGLIKLIWVKGRGSGS